MQPSAVPVCDAGLQYMCMCVGQVCNTCVCESMCGVAVHMCEYDIVVCAVVFMRVTKVYKCVLNAGLYQLHVTYMCVHMYTKYICAL